MEDIKLFSHAICTYSRPPIYIDYYLADNDIRATCNRDGRGVRCRGDGGRGVRCRGDGGRVWGLDVWRDLQERRRWAISSTPSWLLNIKNNTRDGKTRCSGNTRDPGTMKRLSQGIHITNRIRRPCTVEIPCQNLHVNIRDGVCLYKGRATLERVLWRSPLSPAVVAIHLHLPDGEPFRKFKDLSNHLARVVEEPDDRGFCFWFIRRGQWNTPIKGSSAYFIDLDGKHKKYKIHAGDCITFVVVVGKGDSISSRTPPHAAHPQRPHARDSMVQTDRIVTENKAIQTRDEKRIRTKNRQIHTTEETRNQTHKHAQTSESPPPLVQDLDFDDGEEVLARWEDDRWYYKGRIVRRFNYSYCVEDSTGRHDVISREHIIHATDHYDVVSPDKRASDCVLAPHPIYYWSYAPGRVMETLGQHLTVRFYDNNQKNINRCDVYPARNREKHDKDVAQIRQREKDWEGLEAFIRDESGVYKLGTVEEQIGRQQKYAVRWDDGQCGEQMSIHIYGTYTPMIKFKVGSYILALVDPDRIHSLPGQVRNVHGEGDDQRLEVEFVNGKSSKNVLSRHSYWMNKMAFLEAKEMFLRHHQDRSDEEDSPRYD